jgi:hypothetical protein
MIMLLNSKYNAPGLAPHFGTPKRRTKRAGRRSSVHGRLSPLPASVGLPRAETRPLSCPRCRRQPHIVESRCGSSNELILGYVFLKPIMIERKVAPSRLEGCVDEFASGMIRGWTWDSSQPNRRLNIYAFVNDCFIGRYQASLIRTDLLALSKGDGRYGFDIDASKAFLRIGKRKKVVRVITEEPEAWSIRIGKHALNSISTRIVNWILGRRRPEPSASTQSFVTMLLETEAHPKRMYELNQVVGEKAPDPFAADYTLLAIEFLRREASQTAESMRKDSLSWLRGWFRLWLLEFQLRRLSNLGYAIAASQNLMQATQEPPGALVGQGAQWGALNWLW